MSRILSFSTALIVSYVHCDQNTSIIRDEEFVSVIRWGDTLMVRDFLAKNRSSNSHDIYGNSVLIVAIQFNRTEIVRLLLGAGANANGIADHPRVATPLMEAALVENVDIVAELINRGANLQRRILSSNESNYRLHETVDEFFQRLRPYGNSEISKLLSP